MTVYWLSFELAFDDDYDARYDELMEAIKEISTKRWAETTSFVLFESNSGIDAIADAVNAAIDARKDVVLIGLNEIKGNYILGKTPQAAILQSLAPLVKKL